MIRYLSSVFQYASFVTSHDYIWKSIFLKLYYRGSQTFKFEEIYVSEKKSVLKSPGRIGILWSLCSKIEKMPLPNIHIAKCCVQSPSFLKKIIYRLALAFNSTTNPELTYRLSFFSFKKLGPSPSLRYLDLDSCLCRWLQR